MAQMPRGEPRTVPDPVGDLYNEMIRQDRLRKERAQATTNRLRISMDSTPFAPADPGAPFRQDHRLRSTVTIGGQDYREVDNGHANVLVPADDPLVPPAELARRRASIERALFMANYPLGGAAYGVAALMGASNQTRDQALSAGAIADDAMSTIEVGGPRIRGPSPTRGGRIAPAASPQPSIRLRETNALGQALGANATLAEPMLGTGTKAYWRRTPPGWAGDGRKNNQARGHLLANQLGGSGSDMRNLVTLTQKGANTPQMRAFEDEAARRVRAGEIIEYSAVPLYTAGVLPPGAILLSMIGSRGAPTARVILNPAGRGR